MKGSIIAVAGKHVVLLHFEDNKEWSEVMKHFEGPNPRFKPYFEARASFAADILVNSLNSPAMQLQATQPPKCEKHNTPMKASERGGWYCPKKDMDDYCTHTVDDNGVYHREKITRARRR